MKFVNTIFKYCKCNINICLDNRPVSKKLVVNEIQNIVNKMK